VGLAVSLLTFLAVAVRVYRVAGLSSVVAAGIVAHAGPGAVLLGTLTTSLPGILITASIWLLYLLLSPLQAHWRGMILGALLVIELVLTYVLPWQGLMFQVAFVVVVFFFLRNRSWSVEWLAIVAGALFIFASSTAPWLPAEQLTIAGTSTPIIGYVLEDDGPWMTVLVNDPRTIESVQAAQVTGRRICSTQESRGPGKSVFDLVSDSEAEPNIPSCGA
jgi:hypothetical protein